MGKQSGKHGPDPGNGGRPTLYKPEYEELSYNYTLLGAKDEDLAKFFEVSESTLNTWKHEHPNFLESIKRGKAIADAEMAKSLFKRGLGYEYQEKTTTTEKIRDKNGKLTGEEIIKTVTYEKQQAPDTGAACMWLKNRQKELWRDKHEIDLSGTLQVIFDKEDEDLG